MNNKKTDKTVKKPSKPWEFKPGNRANPNGRLKGAINEVTKFKEAIALFEKEQQKSIYDFILKKSLTNPQVLVAIFKALIPQHIETETKVTDIYNPYEKLSDEELIEQTYAILKRTGGMKQLKKLEEEELKALENYNSIHLSLAENLKGLRTDYSKANFKLTAICYI